jgi:VWFA-related protein
MKAPPAEGSTAIWDAIAVTASEVLARNSDPKVTGFGQGRKAADTVQRQKDSVPMQRRRAIILLTDGRDYTSRLSRREAINRALDAETVIYAIGIGDKKYGGVDQGELNAVANATGGRAFFPKRDTDLGEAFAQIEQELRSQYLIAYSPANKKRDGSYRQMRVEITNPDLQKEQLQLRHRPGYFAKAP